MPKSSKQDMPAAGKLSRRALLKHSAVTLGAGLAGTTAAQAEVVAGSDPFDYEVTHTEAEWRAQLTEADYSILRDGETEAPFTHPYWELNEAGTYHCKGCDLLVYSSVRKFFPNGKGWVFFTAAEPNSQLHSIDPRSDMAPELVDSRAEQNDVASNFFIEAHCRRCGSHHGHILSVESRALHCINGAALEFKATTA